MIQTLTLLTLLATQATAISFNKDCSLRAIEGKLIEFFGTNEQDTKIIECGANKCFEGKLTLRDNLEKVYWFSGSINADTSQCPTEEDMGKAILEDENDNGARDFVQVSFTKMTPITSSGGGQSSNADKESEDDDKKTTDESSSGFFVGVSVFAACVYAFI